MKAPPNAGPEFEFYADAIRILQRNRIPFLVGGAYALREYTGVIRDTKDFDVFIVPQNVSPALEAFREAGYRGEIAFSHWLAKIHHGESFIDLIFRSGNGLCEVDDLWFQRSETRELLGERVGLVPPEEMIWQKAYIMERERFDGADIAHLIRSCGEKLDWEHLLRRMGEDLRVLASHLLVFGFVYPGERSRIPGWVMARCVAQMQEEPPSPEVGEPLCQGTLISRAQYLPDIERWGYKDVRLIRGEMKEAEIDAWTDAIGPGRAG